MLANLTLITVPVNVSAACESRYRLSCRHTLVKMQLLTLRLPVYRGSRLLFHKRKVLNLLSMPKLDRVAATARTCRSRVIRMFCLFSVTQLL